MYRVRPYVASACILAAVLSACTLIAPYDDTFDQSLNKFSDDTAKFLASAKTGGPEQLYKSKETTAYYASTYNLLDQLSARARLSRAIPCPGAVQALKASTAAKPDLPDDYEQFDCREVQLYTLHANVKQMEDDHLEGGTLNKSEIRADGGAVQTATFGAIQTFLVNKPSK